jgi:hypothetical protein
METETATSFVPAPDGDHGGDEADGQQCKLMVVGSFCCNRNKGPHIPLDGKFYCLPVGLSNLSKSLFDNFVKDIQQSMRDRHLLFFPNYFRTWVSLLLLLFVLEPFTFYSSIHLVVAGLLIWSHANHQKDLQCEIETRIQEWQPLFAKEGFVVRFIVDKKLCRDTESYLHIYRAQSTDQPSGDGSAPHNKEEANYVLIWARSFRRRNTTFRTVPVSPFGSPFDILYVQPPALHNLDGAVFRSFFL